MDQEKIRKLVERMEFYLFNEKVIPEYDLKEFDIILKYLIYQQLKDIDNNLQLIGEALSIDELKK